MNNTVFYHCPICGNVITKLSNSGVTPSCCGQEMEELVPKTQDPEVGEKHVPVMTCNEGCMLHISIGAVIHPMTAAHHIQFIYLQFKDKDGHMGGRFVNLNAEDRPECDICTCSIKVEAVYEYCNIHGLWKTECNEENCPELKCLEQKDSSQQESSNRCYAQSAEEKQKCEQQEREGNNTDSNKQFQ